MALNAMSEISVEELSNTSGFGELGLSDAIVKGVSQCGYKEPTQIQKQAIPIIMNGRDLLGASHTGSGKTAAFALPILSLLDRPGPLRCLVLEPTRELAQQVEKAFLKYGRTLRLKVTLLHGGVGYGKQTQDLQRGVDIVVATPGRLLDHLSQKALTLQDIRFLVLDEGDRMLDMGFIPDLRRIIGHCPQNRQSMLFSATLGPEMERVANWVVSDPVRISIGGGKALARSVKHAIYPVDDRQKFDLLLALLEQIDYRSVIIFCRTKLGADMIARWLSNTKYRAVILHSDRSQKERDQALEGFKSGAVEILVATDIVARGIDIMDVSHVINYDIPQNPEDYVHRIGRTGRMDREGDAFSLFTASDQDFLKNIERFIGQTIKREKIENFPYNWSPILEERTAQRKRRNRGYDSSPTMNIGRRKRR